MAPAEDQEDQITSAVSVIETRVLLNVDLICAYSCIDIFAFSPSRFLTCFAFAAFTSPPSIYPYGHLLLLFWTLFLYEHLSLYADLLLEDLFCDVILL